MSTAIVESTLENLKLSAHDKDSNDHIEKPEHQTELSSRNTTESNTTSASVSHSVQNNNNDETPSTKENNNGPTKKKKNVNDFHFGKVLGEGAYAQVRLATELDTQNVYAVKIVDKRQLLKEKKTKMASVEKTVFDMCKHPNIVFMYSTFQDPDSLYFLLEYCPNGDLLDLIKKYGRLDETSARFYAAEVLCGLDYLHSNNIIHRDLKPENVLLDRGMHSKITDFGTAKILSQDSHSTAQRGRASSFTGTADYVSPELLKDKTAAKSSDLWAFGCMMYQMLAGTPPFRGVNDYQTFQFIINRTFSFPNNITISNEAKDLIDRLLELDPSKRLGCMMVETTPSPSPSPSPPSPPATSSSPPQSSTIINPNNNNSNWHIETCISEIKKHPFFDGIDWDSLHKLTPPSPSKYSDNNNVNNPNTVNNNNNNNITGELGMYNRDQQKNSIWNVFLEPNEAIIHTALVWKKTGLFSKKRQFILTDKPRLFYVDPETMVVKGHVKWTSQMQVSVKNARHFTITVPSRTYYLEDIMNAAQKWFDAINQVLCMATTNNS